MHSSLSLCLAHGALFPSTKGFRFWRTPSALKNGGNRDRPGLGTTPTTAVPPGCRLPLTLASSLPPELPQLLALICSHLTPCAPKWMCPEISQTQRTNSVSFPTSTSAVLHLFGLRAWQDTWQGKSILQRAPSETCSRNTQVKRKAVQL